LWFPDAAAGVGKAKPITLSPGPHFEALAKLCSMATVRFGPPRPEHLAVFMRLAEPARLEALIARAMTVGSWDELLAAP
jgi:hypothetical protein